MQHQALSPYQCTCTRCECYKSFVEDNGVDMDEMMLELLTHQGFLRKQETPSGKVWYARTGKQLPYSRTGSE